MTACGTGGMCRHSAACSDHHCPGRGEPPAPAIGFAFSARQSVVAAASTFGLVLAFALVLAVAGPAIDDHSDEIAQAASAQDAIRAEAAQARFERAAQAVCGENGAWARVDHQTVQCFTHRGAKTQVAKVGL